MRSAGASGSGAGGRAPAHGGVTRASTSIGRQAAAAGAAAGGTLGSGQSARTPAALNVMYIKPSMPGIEQLNGKNYAIWSMRVQMAAEHLDLWPAIATDMRETNVELDRRAKTYLGMHVTDLHLFTVMHAASAKAAWDALKSQHSAAAKSRSCLLHRTKVNFCMNDGQSVLEYVMEAKQLESTFALAGEPLTSDQAVTMVLAGLPDRFSTIVQILQNSAESITLDDCLTRLLVAEQMVAAREKEPTAYIGHVNNGNTFKRVRFHEDGGSSRAGGQHVGGGGGGKQFGGQRSGQFGRSNGGGFKGTCWHCNEVGHIKADCELFHKVKKQRREQRAHFASGQDLGATGNAI